MRGRSAGEADGATRFTEAARGGGLGGRREGVVRRHGGEPHRSGRRRRGKASHRRVRPGRSCVPRTRAPAPRAGGAPQQVARVARAVQAGPGAGAASRTRARGRARARAAAAAPPSEPHPRRVPRFAGASAGIAARPARPGAGIFSGPKQHRTYRRRRILALALLLVGALVVWFLIAFFQPPPFDPGNGSGEAIVTVPQGASASDVADLLTKNDVVSNGTLFEWRLKLAGKTGEILPGRYVLAHNMSYGTAIDRLTSSGGKINVTIPEGEDRTQIAATIKDLGLSGDYLAASKSSQGLRPEQVRRPEPEVPRGIPLPGHLPARSGVERRSVRLGPAAGLPAEHRRCEHVVREVEEPHGL